MAEGVAVEPRRRNERPSGSAFWLIFADEHQLMHPVTVTLPGGGEALAIFSSEEEAEMFLWLGMEGDGWRTGETSAGESSRCCAAPARRPGAWTSTPSPRCWPTAWLAWWRSTACASWSGSRAGVGARQTC
jgi:hypothetical protein